MSKALVNDPSREHEIHETLMCILAETDPEYMSAVNRAQFEQGLIDEMHFLLPGDEEDMQHIEQYIHAHGEELYQTALTSCTQRRASMAL
jgi:hypothetical protein